MTDIVTLIESVAPYVSPTTLRQMGVILAALITMRGRVTMRGIARWTEKGGSYRTVQRFFQTVIPWSLVFWGFFRVHVYKAEETYVLVGDECVVSKSGKQTHGLGRFFSSLYGTAIPGVSFFTLSLVSVGERRSYPVMVEQVIRTEEEKRSAKANKQREKEQPQTVKGKAGRPKGSQNKVKSQVVLTPELTRVKAMVVKQMALIKGDIPLAYLALDGHFGNHNALEMARQCDLHLISKLRHDAALYFPYANVGLPKKRGAPRKYGTKVDYAHLPAQALKERVVEAGIQTDAHLPAQALKERVVEAGIQTDTYQATLLHKAFAQPLNVVIILKTDTQTGKQAHVILFSSDLELPYEQLIDSYSLRFQIEFNFRDAKQFWGLEDFMNLGQTAVTNAANLSLFMVNLSHLLLRTFRQDSPGAGILDLKTHYQAHKYVTETLKLLPEMPEPIFIQRIFASIARIGRIHATNPPGKVA